MNLRAWCAAASLALLLSALAAPAHAQDRTANDESLLELLEQNGVDVVESTSGSSDVSLPRDGDGELIVTSGRGSIAVEFPANDADTSTEIAPGIRSYSSSDGIDYIALEHEDGAQIVSVIHDGSAPEEYSYPLSGDFTEAEVKPDGTVLLFGRGGVLLGGFYPAWAKDAAGRKLTTYYRLEGRTLVQVVEHRGAADVAYPVVADPKYAAGVVAESIATKISGGWKVSARLSAWGRAVYFTDSRILAVEGWKVLKDNHWQIRDARWRTSLSQQWDCHIAGGWLEWDTWDLETTRPNNSKWRDRIWNNLLTPASVCNW